MVAVAAPRITRVLQRELGRRQFGEHEYDVVQRERRRRYQRRCVRRERRVEQRQIGQEHRIEQNDQAERQRRPAPALQFDRARRTIFASDHGITAAAEQEFLALQQQYRQHQQRHRGGSGQLQFRRVLEQAPDLGGHDVEAGRQGEDRGRTEQRHRLQESDQRAGDKRRQRQRNGDAPCRGPGPCRREWRRRLRVPPACVERVGDQHEHERKRVTGDDEDDSG